MIPRILLTFTLNLLAIALLFSGIRWGSEIIHNLIPDAPVRTLVYLLLWLWSAHCAMREDQ